jgi:predicted ATP-dependent endonuclease of OLD family
VRRLILLSFFRAEVERKLKADNSAGVIYAIEEPETAQHPDNQSMVIETLKELSGKEGCQILLTTHVPGLAGMLPPESIRYISKDAGGDVVIGSGGDEIYRTVADALGVIPDPVAVDALKLLVCVEGPHDVCFLNHISSLLHSHDSTIPYLEADPRVAIMPLGGSTLKDWARVDYLRKLGKPEWHIYDLDTQTPPKYQEACDTVNARGGGYSARLTGKREMENYLHPDAIAEIYSVSVALNDMDSVPSIVARAVHDAAQTGRGWDELKDDRRKEKISAVKRRLNTEVVSKMSIERLKEIDSSDEVIGWFRDLAVRLG